MSMRTVVIKKVTNAAVTIVIILAANFILFRLMPGVPEIIAQKAVWTLVLVGTSTILTIWVGILIGAISAWRRGKGFDLAALGFGFFFYAVPTFWFGYVLKIIFQENIGLIPVLPGDFQLPLPYPTNPWELFV